MLLTDNHFTPVLGIDIHFTAFPPFNPFHPYIGIVLDPMDYMPFVGTNVQIKGKKRGVSDTNGIILTIKHIPLFTPPWIMAPIIGHQSMNFFASKKVFADSTRLSPKGHMLMTCNDIGIPLSLQPGKKKFWKLIPTLFAPTSYSLPISFGPKVNVGGPFPPDWGGIISGLVMSFGFGAVMKVVGKGVGKGIKGIRKGLNKAKAGITKFNYKLKAKKGPNKLSKFLCHLGFEPVNLVTGAVVYEGTDFTIPGIMPLEWKRAWYSDSDYAGPLGHGVHSNYDLDVEIFPDEEIILVRAEDGRIIEFPLLEINENYYLREEKMTLTRNKNGFELFLHPNQITYFFEHRIFQYQYKISRIQNTAAFSLQFYYSGGVLSEIIDTANRKIKLYRNGEKIIRIVLVRADINKEEDLVQYQYDQIGNMIGITDGRNQTTHIHYKGTLMVKKTDRNGQSFYWEYDGTDYNAKCIHTWGDGGLQEGRMEYYPQKGFNCIIDSQGAETYYYYTSDQLVTQIKDPLGNSKFFHYTEFMELYREIDEEGNCTGYSYDDNGNQTAITYPDGSEQIFMYDQNNRLTLTISPEGQKKSYVYKEKSPLLHAIIEPDDSITVFEYNEKNLLSEVRKNGNSVFLSYDNHNNLISLSNTNKLSTEWSYDFRGNVTRVKNAQGINQHFKYDKLARVTSIRSHDQETFFRYNAYEEIIEALDGNKKINFQYTPLGSLLMREQNGIKVQFYYDKMERIKEIRNQKNEKYQFFRNSRGDINREVSFDRMAADYIRDRAGKVIKIIKSGGAWTIYEYNLAGQIIQQEYSDGTWETFDYNKNGQLVEARNQDNCVKLLRDKAGRVIKEIHNSGLPQDKGHHIISSFDDNGNRKQLKSSLGADIQNTFDENGNLLTLTANIVSDQNSSQWKARITRNLLGQEIEKELNGRIKLTTSYDEQGRIFSSRVHSGRTETYNRQYSWSPGHQLNHFLNGLTQGKTEFSYDSFGNLASAGYQDGSYDYKLPDEVGNLYSDPQKSDQIYGASGKILKDKNWNYLYDKQGNLILKTPRNFNNSANNLLKDSSFLSENINSKNNFWIEENEFDRKAEIRRYSKSELKQYDKIRKKRTLENSDPPKWQQGDWEYQWQGNGMLKAVRNPQGKWIRFEYDALGRRTAKIANTKIYRYLWDGNVLLHEWFYENERRSKVISDELGMLMLEQPEPIENLTTWVYEEGSLVPTAKLCEGKSYSIVSDYLGRPAQAYDDKGKLVWQVEFDIYGRIREDIFNNKLFIPFRQLGQYEDKELDGLYYNRFRYYDSNTGTYISQDPIGLQGNNPNFYAYVHDTNTLIDPFGLSPIPIDRFPSWMPTKQGYQRHHIIPYSLRNHTLFQKSGLDINNATNMKYLPVAEGIDPNPNKSLHKGFNSVHADYNDIMGKRLDALERVATKEKWSPTRIQTEIHNLQHRTRAELDSGKLKCH
ncbi:DUF6531 domain-containing protein [Apibacter mensalis]|uniref:DUF6531 domain-containing protein n=2 Tax=Apibacter TaxID=1778601 RepID=UPI0026F0C5E5|nr:DUF6531 domain-containing protein [Apibacter mensalis]